MAVAAVLVAAGCAGGDGPGTPSASSAAPSTVTTAASGPPATGTTASTLPPEPPRTATTTAAPPATTTTAAPPAEPTPRGPAAPQEIRLRLDRRVGDDATAGFEAAVRATLADPRGWQQAGFVFTFGDDAPYTVVLAEGDEVDRLCRPYDTGGRFSCQRGPVVALNADRWREATPQWPGDPAAYRRMLVNHEVGHLLGQHHPVERCPVPGRPAPVMAQQSAGTGDCLPNPWPLPWEIDCAARRLEPLAPGYEADPTPLCGPEG